MSLEEIPIQIEAEDLRRLQINAVNKTPSECGALTIKRLTSLLDDVNQVLEENDAVHGAFLCERLKIDLHFILKTIPAEKDLFYVHQHLFQICSDLILLSIAPKRSIKVHDRLRETLERAKTHLSSAIIVLGGIYKDELLH